MQLAFYNARVNFFVCRSLVTRIILGVEFCDKSVQSILNGSKVAELEDGTAYQSFAVVFGRSNDHSIRI